MNFEVLIDQDIFKKIPIYRIKQIKQSIKELKENPYPGSNKDEIKGYQEITYRLRVGNYRVFYEIDEEQKIVFVTEILTAEQAHKKYRHLD
jgi:mRNA interferase RelE/StbE